MRRALALLLLAQVALALWFVTCTTPGTDAAWRGLPLDDAWIHLVYGRALLETGRPEYNPGQLEAGFTSPLQMGVAALAVALSRLGLPVAAALKGLTLLCSLPATALAAAVASRRAGERAGVLAAALVALSPTLTFAGVSGMEVGLTASLLLATRWAIDEGRRGLGGALLAGAVLARPEAVLAVPLALPALGWRIWPVFAGLAAWAGYDLAVTGHPLPATFYAKARGFEPLNLLAGARALLAAWPAMGLGLGMIAWGLAVGSRLRSRSWTEAGWALLPLAWFLGVAGGRAVAATDQYFYSLRYFLPVEPLLAVELAVGAALLLAHPRGRPTWIGAAVVIALQLWMMPARRDLYAWHCQNIEEMQGAVAGWIAEHAPGEPVASVDAGRLRYALDQPVFDAMGLNNQELLFNGLREVHRDPAAMAAWMDQRGARLLFTFPLLEPFAAGPEAAALFEEVARVSSANYTLGGPEQGVAVLLRRR